MQHLSEQPGRRGNRKAARGICSFLTWEPTCRSWRVQNLKSRHRKREKKTPVCHPVLNCLIPVQAVFIKSGSVSFLLRAGIIIPLLWPLPALCLHLPGLETKQKSQVSFGRVLHVLHTGIRDPCNSHRFKQSCSLLGELCQAEVQKWVFYSSVSLFYLSN